MSDDAQRPTPPPAIFFATDFGTSDAYAGTVEAVMLGISRSRVVHLTHGIPPQDLANGSWQLWAAAPHLPRGSIVLAVVDPGVGSARRAVVVQGERCTWVAPDNGLCEAAWSVDTPQRAFELAEPAYRLPTVSATFHGRDVFGPAAAHLSRGVDPSELGPAIPVGDLERLGLRPHRGERGRLWTFDRFGNAITTLFAPDEPPRAVELATKRARGLRVPWSRCYADVSPGSALALAGSGGLVEISVRDGSARDELELTAETEIVLLDPQGSGSS